MGAREVAHRDQCGANVCVRPIKESSQHNKQLTIVCRALQMIVFCVCMRSTHGNELNFEFNIFKYNLLKKSEILFLNS